MPEKIRYAAEVRGVQELTLKGTADLAYWNRLLKPHGLIPLSSDGRARILIMGGRLRWKGFRFREISFSVELQSRITPDYRDAACLIQAFNTNRFFAFSERTFFSTPYVHAKCDVDLEPPRHLRITRGGVESFAVQMPATPERPAVKSGPDGQFGPVYLLPASEASPLRYFVGNVKGDTRILPWNEEFDTLTLNPEASEPGALLHLRNSGFSPLEWHIREDAYHGKGVTRTVTGDLP